MKQNPHKNFKRRVRKDITHRNGIPLFTRDLKNKLQEHTNPLEQLIIIMVTVFPNLLTDLGNLTDNRNQSHIEYSMQEISLIRLLALCCGITSVSGIVAKLDKKEFLYNINSILDSNLKKFPCDDTISNVINDINIIELEKLRNKLVRKLIMAKSLDNFRLFNNSFYIVIDGTGLFTTKINLGENSTYKVFNKGTENEYTSYQYYVLEAKLVCSDFVFSFATEFIENSSMNNESEKQDCELKAGHRLLKKIRNNFPKLPITIGGDALYANKPFMDACEAHNMDYIIRYKDTVMTTLYEEFENIDKMLIGKYEYVNDIGYGSGTKNSEGKTNIIRLTEENRNFMFITSFKINNNNYEKIVIYGRNRWKIENQGFKAQKGNILNIEHCYTFDSNGTKAHYFFIQIAHLLLTILYYGSSIVKKLKETKTGISFIVLLELTKIQDLNLNQGFQMRFS